MQSKVEIYDHMMTQCGKLIGLSIDDAKSQLLTMDLPYKINHIQIHQRNSAITGDFYKDRITVVLTDGIITEIVSWG